MYTNKAEFFGHEKVVSRDEDTNQPSDARRSTKKNHLPYKKYR